MNTIHVVFIISWIQNSVKALNWQKPNQLLFAYCYAKRIYPHCQSLYSKLWQYIMELSCAAATLLCQRTVFEHHMTCVKYYIADDACPHANSHMKNPSVLCMVHFSTPNILLQTSHIKTASSVPR